MMDFLYTLDVAVFHFINGALSTAAGDMFWPVITDYDKILAVRIVLVAVWLWLMIKGGKRGRTAALLLVVVIVCSDQLSSFVVKPLVQRPRPCHLVDGMPAVADIHLLVGCGGGKSFPSSHAVNNFAMATVFAFYYRRWRYAFFSWAALIALSRVFVGVHYPSDILGGALVGGIVALAIISAWHTVTRRWLNAWAVGTSAQETA
jgi:undecaprenyl-diphosphatase